LKFTFFYFLTFWKIRDVKETPPPIGPKGTGQCPPAPKNSTQEVEDKPSHLTIEEWAVFNIV
jgi:hypothetical protein